MSSKRIRLEHLLEAVPEALVGMDQQGVVRFVNHQTESLFGYDRDDLVGRHIETLVPEYLWRVYSEHREGYFSDPRARSMGLDLELSGRRQDGTEFPVNIHLSHIDTGDVLLVITAAGEVTKYRQALENSTLLAAIVENSNDAIIGKTLDGIVTSWNPAAERLFGYSSEQVIGRSHVLVVPPDRVDEISALLAKIRAGQQVGHLETMRVRRDGTVFPASLTVSPIYDAEGTIVGASTIVRDITAQVEAHEAARSLIESSQDSLVAISPEGLITDANEATVKVTGVPREELIGTPFSDYFTDPEKANEIYQKVFGAGMAGDYPLTIRRRDGSVTEVLYSASVHRGTGSKVLAVFAAARDVTRLNEALESARSLIESSQDSLVAISPEGLITDLNEATVRVTGVPRQELIGTPFSDYFTDPEKANEIYQQVFAQDGPVDFPLTIRHRDGTLTQVLYNASVYRSTSGKVLAVFAAARDVTRLNEALEAARSMIESSQDALVAISPEGLVTDLNEATVKVTGVPREELIGTPFSDYFTDPDKARNIYQRVLAQGMAVDYPLTMLHRDGTLTEVLCNASVYRNAGGKVLGVFVAARDVTAQMQAQRLNVEQHARELGRLRDLEQFQQLVVGRELKMIELKKEIEYLRKRLPADGIEPGDQP